MNAEELVRRSLERQADEMPLPLDLLGRSQQAGRRLVLQRRLGLAGVAICACVAGLVGFTALASSPPSDSWQVGGTDPVTRHVGAVPAESQITAFLQGVVRESPARNGTNAGTLVLEASGTTPDGVQFAVARFSGDPTGALRWAVGKRDNFDETWVDYEAGKRGFTELDAEGWSLLVARPGTDSAAVFSRTGSRVETARAFAIHDGVGLLHPVVSPADRPQLTLALQGAAAPYYDGDYFE